MKNNNILYLSYDGITDPLGQSQVLPYIIGLSKKGYSFTLISFEKSEKYEKRKAIIQAICKDSNIEWLPFIYTKFPPVFSTIKDIQTLRQKVKALHKIKNFDIIHCRSYITALVGLEMKQKYGVKFIFDMRGFWADERVDGKIWNLKNPLYRLIYNYFKKKEKQFFENADYVVSLTEAGKKEIHSWSLNNNPIPIEVIPCCTDLSLFSSSNIKKEDQQQLRKELGIQEHNFVLSYLGSIGTWYMLDEMLLFFKQLLNHKPEALFFFITGENKEVIFNKCLRYDIPVDKIIIKRAERNEVPLYLSISHLNIFFILPVFSKKASSPTKQGEVMSMGIPIICNDRVGDSAEILLKNNGGYVLSNFDNESYNEIIQEIETKKKNKEEIIKGALYFDLNSGINKYEKIYTQLI